MCQWGNCPLPLDFCPALCHTMGIPNKTHMRSFLAALALAATTVLPASATPLAVDNGLMADVPNIGPSRVETISFCLTESGVDKYQDLITDMEFDTFTACMHEMT